MDFGNKNNLVKISEDSAMNTTRAKLTDVFLVFFDHCVQLLLQKVRRVFKNVSKALNSQTEN